MLLLSETPNGKVTYSLSPRNYTGLYNKLKSLLDAEALALFAHPEVYPAHVDWSSTIPGTFTRGEVRNFEQLSEEEKVVVSNTLDTLRARILTRLKDDPEFRPIASSFFQIPSSQDIKVIKQDGRLRPVITQWACRANEFNSDIDPLTTTLDRTLVNTAPVVVEITYTDGSVAARRPFFIHYMGVDLREISDQNGCYNRGRCLLNSTFSVFDLVDDQKTAIHTFRVTLDGTYKVCFPSPAPVPPPAEPQLPEEPITLEERPVTEEPPVPEEPEPIPPPPHPPVKVRLLDIDGKPMAGIPLALTTERKIMRFITDADGYCTVPFEWFADRKKVLATMRIPKKDEADKPRRESTIKKNFRFKKENLEYTIQLRRKRKWGWWLLLLLLPLLLLIRLEKDVYVETVFADTHAPQPNTTVNFDYEQAFLYSAGHFFTRQRVNLQAVTDTAGKAGFLHLRYSVYSYIFRHFSLAHVSAGNSCYTSAGLSPVFHNLSDGETIILPMHQATVPLDFKIIDREDKEVLPDAHVTAISLVNGQQYIDTATSDLFGKVTFQHLPGCGGPVKVLASLEGYYPDSLLTNAIEQLRNNIDNRTLALQPVKKPIEFFVKDCKTGLPIGDVAATLDFIFNGKRVQQIRHTNIDGVGKGYYPDAYLISKVHISGEKPYYKKGELPGLHDVKDFINPILYPREKRTFCLEPDGTLPPPCQEPPQESRPGSTAPPVVMKSFDMKRPGVSFYIKYEMYTEKDAMDVYCGSDSTGRLLNSTHGLVSGSGQLLIDLKGCGPSTWVTVVVRGSGSTGDEWNYSFICP